MRETLMSEAEFAFGNHFQLALQLLRPVLLHKGEGRAGRGGFGKQASYPGRIH